MIERKRLFFDAETSPNIGTFWSAGFKKAIPYQNIIKERAIICVCWKWEGQRKVNSLTWSKDQCDKQLLETFIPIMNSASEIVAHNGDNFDTKWLRTRCLKHDIDMLPNYISVDTLKDAKKYFYLNSNRMDYIAQFLDYEGKIHTEYELWQDILLHNCDKSLKAMVRYCKRDVILLEKIYNRFKKYAAPKVNYATHTNHCPECNSNHIQIKAYRLSAQGHKKVQFQCLNCFRYHTVAASRFFKEAEI